MQRGGRYRGGGGTNTYRGGRGGSRGRGRGQGQGSIQPLRGLFASNIWHCDCTPRLPAEHFKVKKEGRNQGRWFYTCQNRNKGPGDKKGGCDFFLWDEDAKLREEGSLLGNGKVEDRQEGWDAGRSAAGGGEVMGRGLFASSTATGHKSGNGVREDSDTDVSPSPTPTPVANVRKKRNARDASLDNDDEEFGLQSEEEQELAKLDTSSFETPQKVQKTGVYATPATTVRKSGRKLPWVDEVVEPVSPTSTRKTVADYFNTPSKPPAKAVTFEEPPSSSDATTTSVIQTPGDSAMQTDPILPSSPSPSSRYKDALDDPADSSSSLTSEVLSELSTLPNLPPEKISNIRSILSKHDLKTQGVTKGRDISRLALKAKGAKIAELEAKIASLEAEREVDRGIIAGLRWKRSVGVGQQEENEEENDGESLL